MKTMFVKLYKTSPVADSKHDGIHSNLVAYYTGKSVNINAIVCISDCASLMGDKLYHKVYFSWDNITDSDISYDTYVIDNDSYKTIKELEDLE